MGERKGIESGTTYAIGGKKLLGHQNDIFKGYQGAGQVHENLVIALRSLIETGNTEVLIASVGIALRDLELLQNTILQTFRSVSDAELFEPKKATKTVK